MSVFSELHIPSCAIVDFSDYSANGISERSGAYIAFYVCTGSIGINVNGKRAMLFEKSLYIVTPSVFFYLDSPSEDCCLIALTFSPQVPQAVENSLPAVFTGEDGTGVFSGDFTEENGVRMLFYLALRQEAAPAGEWALNGIGSTLLSVVLTYETKKAPAMVSGRGIKGRLNMVTDHILRNMACSDENSAAENLGLSCSYFSRSFKAATGIGFHEYVNFLRINEAKRLLKGSDTDIAALAEKLGYSSASHFINVFKKATGVSPKQYKKLCSEKVK